MFFTQHDCCFILSPSVKLALTYIGVYISLKYEHPGCSSAQSNPTTVIWSRQGVKLPPPLHDEELGDIQQGQRTVELSIEGMANINVTIDHGTSV